jgi:RHS repeat-associated protein
LGRLIQVTAQDGGITTTDYSNLPTVTVTDPAGKLRRSRRDALGRLVEVDEPGPGANGPGTPGSGSITVSGALASSTSSGTKSTASFTVNGSEQTFNPPGACYPDPSTGLYICDPPGTTVYDGGVVSVTVNGFAVTVNYAASSTAANLAGSLAAGFNVSGSPVSASASGATVSLTANQAGPNYAMSQISRTSDPTDFGSASFTVTLSAASTSGGVAPATTYDSGTLTVTVNGFQASAPYNQNTNNSASAMAQALTNALNASASPVRASLSSTTITLTATSVGTATNFTVTGSSTRSFTASSTTLAGGTNPGGLYAPYVTNYSYDALGNLTQVNQQGDGTQAARVRTFSYDSLSRLLTANNPESGRISYQYDANGNLLQKTSPAPNQTGTATQTISYCYDALNRETGRAYSAQSCSNGQLPSGTAAVSYVYDQGGAAANAIGHMTSWSDQAGTGSYSFDVLGRMAGETRSINPGIAGNNGVQKNMSYSYNLDGSLKALTYPSGAVITYTPDTAGRMLSAVDNGNAINYATGATYGPHGSMTGFVSGNSTSFAGITNSFSYNQRLQPINMSAASPSATVFSLNYDFHSGNSNNGNVFGITNNKDTSRNQTFTYDALNRLISAQNAGTDCNKTLSGGQTEYWGNNYSYDAWGNLLAKSVTKCSAENLSLTALANNQLSGYGYDAAGNMTNDATSGFNYSYDQENRITGAGGFAYTYDADGNRVEKSNGSTGTLYWYMSPGIVAESDLTGNMQSEYVFFDGERVARKDFPSGAVSYYFSDHLKTTDIVTDAQGNIKNESDFYPWGGELPFVANDSNHYKFTGKERDTETQLDYFGARYYSNGLGRFITPDWSAKPVPVPYAAFSDPQTLCQYCYVRGLPTTKADADGHGFFTKVKNLFTDGGFNEDADAQKERARRQHQRAENARKTLSGMKGFTINGMTPAEFAKGANDQQALAGLNAATNFVFGEAQKNFFCHDERFSCGIVFPVGGMGMAFEEGAASEYINVTRAGSVSNIKTNVTAGEFGANLEANGFVKSTAADGTPTYTKGSTQYTVYSSSRSTGGPTAQVKINGEVVGKIRLQ